MNRQKGYSGSMPMKDVIRDNDFLLHVISRFDIAFGFGDRTVREVCTANGVHMPTFIAVCNLISGYDYDHEETSLSDLIRYLRNAHKSILDITLPHIRHHLLEGIGYSDADNKVAILLMKFFDEYVSEVRMHMENENDEIFSHAERLMSGEASGEFSIAGYSADHRPMSDKLSELKDLFIYHFTRHDNYRLSAVLFDIILCEKDLSTHFEVENKLFVPAVQRLEEMAVDTPESRLPADTLSEREKEIIHYIAKGLSNKQIADCLFLSTHTVSTHRRNICAKLDIHSASGLTIYAIVHKLIDVSELEI